VNGSQKSAPVTGSDFTECCAAGLSCPIPDESAEQLASVVKALAHPARLQLLALIRSSPTADACVCDLTDALSLRQPTVSHHLKILTDAGILRREQRATWAWYSIEPQRLTDLAALLTS
jgi:ArsR family transcriptional regulator